MKQLDQKLNKHLVYRIIKQTLLLPVTVTIGIVMVIGMCVGEWWCNINDE